jgi:hypothetical protein
MLALNNHLHEESDRLTQMLSGEALGSALSRGWSQCR